MSGNIIDDTFGNLMGLFVPNEPAMPIEIRIGSAGGNEGLRIDLNMQHLGIHVMARGHSLRDAIAGALAAAVEVYRNEVYLPTRATK